MPAYAFTLILETDPDLDQVDRLYGHFNDDLLSGVRAGVPYLDCHIKAASFEEAVGLARRALDAEALVLSDSLSAQNR